MRVVLPHYEQTAAGYYRLIVPLIELKSQGFCEVIFREECEGQEEESLNWASIINLGRINDEETAAITFSLQRYGKKIVIDQDDYPEAVSQIDNVRIQEAWTYDKIEVNQKIIQYCDVLTVSVPFLKEKYSSIRKGPIVVLPNQVDALNVRWNFPRIDNGDKTVIGWLAGPSHLADSEFLSRIVTKAMDANPNIIFKSVGLIDEWMFDLPRERAKLKPGKFQLKKYPEMMADMDIGLAPLIESEFNYGKSDLKYLEYVMAGCLPIVSDVGPYQHLPDAVTIKCKTEDDWVAAIIEMAENKEKRHKYFGKAMRYVVNNRTIYNTADKWYNALKQALED